LRVICGVCDTVGGLGALDVLAAKISKAGWYIVEHAPTV
jgi:hypothetical protein